ncbi:MAG: hypothetical protein PHU80_07745, partial [Kiritimatiellae bacterium]|nr:hypothetical protein [Kiritimatiellia bacterium]
MKKCILKVLAGLPCLGLCSEAVLGIGGNLSLSEPAVAFAGNFFSVDWSSPKCIGLEEPDASGTVKYQLKMADEATVDVAATVSQGVNGDLLLSYLFTPQVEIEINGFFVGCTIPVQQMAGGRWAVDNLKGDFPRELGNAHLLGGASRELRLEWPGQPQGELAIVFDAPSAVMIQDNRKWDSESYSIRLGSAGRKKYAAGVPFKIAFKLLAGNRVNLTFDRHQVLQAGPDWAEIANEKDIEPGSALDFSGMGFVDGPAGKYGWLKAVGPNFEFEGQPGVAQRFYGVNFCFSACFPSAEQADMLAERLVRLGYNSVRIHHHDSLCVQ